MQDTLMDITPFHYSIKDKNILLAAYMPFVKNGGLFLKGVGLPMGAPVGVLIEIPSESMKFGLDGKVVWVHANGMNLGVGIQFAESPSLAQFKVKVEVVLAGLDRTKNPTYTL
jgi:type IV pilus assembly protein PilZ